MLEWNDKFSMGISIIDEDHKKFIDILNKAIFAKEHNDNPEEVKEVLYRITNYAFNHFLTEEAFMIEFDYPDYKSHKEEHSAFSEKMTEYCNRVNEGDCHISNELVEYLKQWIVNHIQVTDRQYVDCFKKNGLK